MQRPTQADAKKSAISQATTPEMHDSGAITPGAAIACFASVTPDELKRRTKAFAVNGVKFARTLPTDLATAILARQLVKSATSVGANYRASCRAKSRADFVSKMTTAEEEADETQYWLELLVDTGTVPSEAVASLVEEGEQLTRIFVASIKTARGKSR
jgi:four helix bundle protein